MKKSGRRMGSHNLVRCVIEAIALHCITLAYRPPRLLGNIEEGKQCRGKERTRHQGCSSSIEPPQA